MADADAEDELVIEQTGPDFMLDELERYMRMSAFSDLSIQCREKLVSSAHCAVLAAVSPFLKKLARSSDRRTFDATTNAFFLIVPDARCQGKGRGLTC